MFSGLAISQTADFEKHLNQYDVIHLDIQWFLSNVSDPEQIVAYITECTLAELRTIYADQLPPEVSTVPDALSRIKEATGQKFVIIIDEWDVLIRDEASNQKIQDDYINFLRGMFKGTEPTKYIQLAFLTGILPIKKLKTQSALNDVNRLLKLDPSNTVLVAQKQELLAQAISQTEEKLSALEAAQEQVAAAFARGDIGADKYQAFQREIEETRGKLNKYKADLSDLQTEQNALSQNTARLEKLFAATGTEVDDYADVLGTRLTSAIKNGTANSDQLRTALEKIGKSATGGKADIRQLTDALDTVDDGQAIQNLIQQLREAGDAAENTADDVGQIAENTKGAALMQAADQLSAVGDKIQEIGDKALDAYTDTENAVTFDTGPITLSTAARSSGFSSSWCPCTP